MPAVIGNSKLTDMTLFFYGANTYALKSQLGQMVDAYLKKAGSDYGLERLEGAAVKLQDLAAALNATPFLASSRLVIVEGVAGNKGVAEKLPQILSKVPVTTVAVFVEREVDQRTAAFKALSKAEKVVKFEPLNGPKLMSWAEAQVKKHDGEAEPGALRELIDRSGEDQWRLSGEINKLVNFNPVITKVSVAQMVEFSLERTIFDLVEAMTAGRTGDALTAYRALTRQKDGEMYVLTMVQWQLRNLLLAGSAPAGMSSEQLAATAGMSGYVAGKMLAASRGVDLRRLARAYGLACDAEFDIKTGRAKAPEAVERLIYRVGSGLT
jgi:DNA polymerase-3 subunit delta